MLTLLLPVLAVRKPSRMGQRGQFGDAPPVCLTALVVSQEGPLPR